jgi:hypothetical protein
LRSTPENAVFFWEDVYPVDNDTRVPDVPMTAEGLLDWMRHDPRLEVSDPQPGRIGDAAATVEDVTTLIFERWSSSPSPTSRSSSCPNDHESGCPGVAVRVAKVIHHATPSSLTRRASRDSHFPRF